MKPKFAAPPQYEEGDDVLLNHDDAVRDAVDEKMRRREEIKWKEQILG